MVGVTRRGPPLPPDHLDVGYASVGGGTVASHARSWT